MLFSISIKNNLNYVFAQLFANSINNEPVFSTFALPSGSHQLTLDYKTRGIGLATLNSALLELKSTSGVSGVAQVFQMLSIIDSVGQNYYKFDLQAGTNYNLEVTKDFCSIQVDNGPVTKQLSNLVLSNCTDSCSTIKNGFYNQLLDIFSIIDITKGGTFTSSYEYFNSNWIPTLPSGCFSPNLYGTITTIFGADTNNYSLVDFFSLISSISTNSTVSTIESFSSEIKSFYGSDLLGGTSIPQFSSTLSSYFNNNWVQEFIYTQAFYFAFPFMENNNFFYSVNLSSTDSDYLKLNQFNYGSALSNLIVSPDYNVLYSPCVIDMTPLYGTLGYYTLTLSSQIQLNSRYYVLQFVDLFTNNFYYISSKTNTSFQTSFELYPPDFTGTLSSNQIKANSWYFLILMRVEVDLQITGDLDDALSFQDGFSLNTNSYTSTLPINLPDSRSLDFSTAGFFETNLNTREFYNQFLSILQWQTYFTSEQLSYLEAFKAIGIYWNQTPFDSSKFVPFYATSEQLVYYNTESTKGLQSLIDLTNQSNTPRVSWKSSKNLVNINGIASYFAKSFIAYQFIYANSEDEAIYWAAYYDDDLNPLNGDNNYTITVKITPPINQPGFWSITAYDIQGYVLANTTGVYTIGNVDYPTILTISSQDPSTNYDSKFYLQVPAENFYVILRMYNTVTTRTSSDKLLSSEYDPNIFMKIKLASS